MGCCRSLFSKVKSRRTESSRMSAQEDDGVEVDDHGNDDDYEGKDQNIHINEISGAQQCDDFSTELKATMDRINDTVEGINVRHILGTSSHHTSHHNRFGRIISQHDGGSGHSNNISRHTHRSRLSLATMENPASLNDVMSFFGSEELEELEAEVDVDEDPTAEMGESSNYLDNSTTGVGRHIVIIKEMATVMEEGSLTRVGAKNVAMEELSEEIADFYEDSSANGPSSSADQCARKTQSEKIS